MTQHSVSTSVSDLWDRYALDPLRGTLYYRRSGRVAPGTSSVDRRNYRKLTATVKLNGRSMSVSYGRVVHAWVAGYWAPKGYHVDHINHNSHDNRPWNLRCVSVRENNQNRKNQISPGIYWNKRLNKWQAQIRIQGKRVYLGVYYSEYKALKSYIQACDANAYPVLQKVRDRLTEIKAIQASG